MKQNGVKRYIHTRVDIYFPEGEMKCRNCPMLFEHQSKKICWRTGEPIIDVNGTGWDCPLVIINEGEQNNG